MKKAIPKLLIFFYLIPWAASMVFIFMDALKEIYYLELAAVSDVILSIPYFLGYYLGNLCIFASFGIIAYYLFFEKAWKTLIVTAFSVLFTAWIPLSHYLLQHFMLKDALYDIAMLDLYSDFFTSMYIYLMNTGLFLLAALAVKAAYSLFLMKKPDIKIPMIAPKNPVGLTALIFYAVAVALALILFISGATYTLDAFGSFGMELLLNVLRFFLTLFAASKTAKWMNHAKKEN